MRRVAAELGTGPASLYAHIAHKEELLEQVFDEVAAEIPLPDPDPARWQEQVRQLWIDSHAAFARNGDIARVALGRVPLGPNSMRVAEVTMAVLRAGGVPDQAAAWAVDVVGLYVVANAIEGAVYADRQRSEQERQAYWTQVADYFAAVPADRFPTTAALAPMMMTGTGWSASRSGSTSSSAAWGRWRPGRRAERGRHPFCRRAVGHLSGFPASGPDLAFGAWKICCSRPRTIPSSP